MVEMVEKYGEKNGDIFGCEFRGVLQRGEPFAYALICGKWRLTTVS